MNDGLSDHQNTTSTYVFNIYVQQQFFNEIKKYKNKRMFIVTFSYMTLTGLTGLNVCKYLRKLFL